MFREAIGRVSAWFFLGGLKKQKGTQMPIPDSYSQPSPTPVTFDSAMQLSAVWACTRLLSETVAGLPVMFTRRNGSEETPLDNDVARLFDGKINRYQTRFEFMETLMLNLVMHGNFFALKERNGAGDLIALQPLMASQVEVRLMDDGSIAYYYYFDSGVQVYSEDSIWHVKLFGNGIIGMSPLGYARNTIGIAQAGEARVANIFKNGGKPSGVLMIDKVLKPDQRDAIRREFNELREGNSDRLMVLEADMKYSQISMTPQDIELLQSRRFQIEDLCRFMGVPSVLVNDTQGSTVWGSGIQQLVQGFYKLNLRPYLERIEASIIFNLMRPEDRPGAVVEFDFDAILRADMAARMDGWQKGINAGVFTPNEARLKEHLEPLDGGDSLYINGNMKPLVAVRDNVTGDEKAPDSDKQIDELKMQIKSWQDEKPVINVDARTTFTQAPTSITMPEIKSPDIHVEVKPTTINVPAPIINMEAKETNITIPPPIINVEAPKQPDRVKMDIVSLPQRVTTSSVNRDSQGNIISTTQTEKDK